jgi:hypothetical protein
MPDLPELQDRLNRYLASHGLKQTIARVRVITARPLASQRARVSRSARTSGS